MGSVCLLGRRGRHHDHRGGVACLSSLALAAGGTLAILEHNRDEEKEHASMVLEWMRRKDARFSSELKDYLFTDKPIAHQ